MNNEKTNQHNPSGTIEIAGAKTSKAKLRLDLVPQVFIRRTAIRFTEGAEKYGDYNYRKGLVEPAFIQDRINHLLNHLSEFLVQGPDTEDDNLAAVAWGIAFLMEAEQTQSGRQAIRDAVGHMSFTYFPSSADKERDF